MENNNKPDTTMIDTVTIGLTLTSIVLSLFLYFTGKKQGGIFVGLWPPTFVALGTLIKQSMEKSAQ